MRYNNVIGFTFYFTLTSSIVFFMVDYTSWVDAVTGLKEMKTTALVYFWTLSFLFLHLIYLPAFCVSLEVLLAFYAGKTRLRGVIPCVKRYNIEENWIDYQGSGLENTKFVVFMMCFEKIFHVLF